MSTIKCSGVKYRQGFIDVTSDIHDRMINIESWNVHPDYLIDNNSNKSVIDVSDSKIVANTELELSLTQAIELVNQLKSAIHKIETGSS